MKKYITTTPAIISALIIAFGSSGCQGSLTYEQQMEIARMNEAAERQRAANLQKEREIKQEEARRREAEARRRQEEAETLQAFQMGCLIGEGLYYLLSN